MDYRKVKSFTLTNKGAFVCDIHCLYYNNDGVLDGDKANKHNMSAGQSKTMDLKNKVPSLEVGQLVQMKAWIALGQDNVYNQMFSFDPNGDELQFEITGVTYNSTITLLN